ncbi:MAG: hypothetical protein QW409_01510 [Candidatus Aenigmatarchaeota archaeon]
MRLTTFIFLSTWSLILFLIVIYIFLYSSSSSPDVCDSWSEDREICNGEIVEYQSRTCQKVCSNCTTGENCQITCSAWNTYSTYDCNNKNYWECKDPKTKRYVDYTCDDGICVFETYRYETYCGDSEETDGGDNPRTYGSITVRGCSNGDCFERSYYDKCSGICSRSELREYWITGKDATSPSYTDYTDLFSKSQYCKNGAIYDDTSNPSIGFSPSSRGWSTSDIVVTLSCNDHDESGCWTYSYNIVNAV